MAKLVKTMMLSMLVIAYSCTESETTSIYYFENESGVDVNIPQEGYERPSIYIEKGQTYTTSGTEMGFGFYFPFGHAEEIEVFFGEDKVLLYGLWNIDDPKNLLVLENYRKVDKSKKHNKKIYKFYYTFTVEQYESAESYEPEE